MAELTLTPQERDALEGRDGPAVAMALRIVIGAAAMLGAGRLVRIASVHVDGCLYHGESGTLFAERLVAEGGAVRVPTTLNVGSLDLLHAGRVRLPAHETALARRMMTAYAALGCRQSWTCAPYQAGHRPALGQDVAWGESNAVCAALTGRAPYTGLHRPENRKATLVVDLSGLDSRLLAEDAFYPVLGAWLGHAAGQAVPALLGLPRDVTEDRLKALGAAAAATGAVGLFHGVGVTPEAPDLGTACQGEPPAAVIRLSAAALEPARRALTTAQARRGDLIDAVALGSPHFSLDEVRQLLACLEGRRSRVPLYVCTGRHVVAALARDGLREALDTAGVTVVADTCIVVTPILPDGAGLLMTNSGKFAHYTKPNTGWDVLYGSLHDCAESAVAGRFLRDESLWT